MTFLGSIPIDSLDRKEKDSGHVPLYQVVIYIIIKETLKSSVFWKICTVLSIIELMDVQIFLGTTFALT